MSAVNHWMKKFAISTADLESLNKRLCPDETPLTHCLLTGKISEAEYFNWAMEQFQLPMVKSDFFAIQIDDVFWNRVKSSYDWQPDLLPLAEWEGVMIIACVHPPADFHFKGNYRFVLASPQNLMAVWHHYATLSPSISAKARSHLAAKLESFLAELPPDPAPLVAKSDSAPEELPIENIAGEEISPPEGELEEPLEMPDGISLNVDDDILAKLDFSAISTAPAAAPPAKEPTSPAAVSQVQETPLVSEVSEVPVASPPAELPATPLPVMSAAATKSATAPTKESPANGELTKSAPSVPNDDSAEARAAQILAEFQDQQKLSNCTTQDEIILHALEIATKTFAGAMILLPTQGKPEAKSGSKLRPIKWTAPFATPRDPAQFGEVELAPPSIFRIVNRTQLPYHGIVKPSAENDRFMRTFFAGAYPAHLTLAPIRYNKKFYGMLMGIAHEPLPYKTTLSATEVLTSEIGAALAALQSPAQTGSGQSATQHPLKTSA